MLYLTYLPRITQSPCDVAMKNSIGNDSHVFVRDAMKACRASSGAAAGPVPAVAARMRLLLGQMIPQTFKSITMPYVPPIPIEYALLLAKLWSPTLKTDVKYRTNP